MGLLCWKVVADQLFEALAQPANLVRVKLCAAHRQTWLIPHLCNHLVSFGLSQQTLGIGMVYLVFQSTNFAKSWQLFQNDLNQLHTKQSLFAFPGENETSSKSLKNSIRDACSTANIFIQLHPFYQLSPTFSNVILFHPHSSTFIHFYPLSSIFIHFHPLLSSMALPWSAMVTWTTLITIEWFWTLKPIRLGWMDGPLKACLLRAPLCVEDETVSICKNVFSFIK